MDQEQIRSELVRQHPHSFAWALHCARFDRSEAEETLQIAYLKVLQGRARFDGRAAFRTWLFGVIRRTAAERRRWQAARALLLDRWRITAAPPAPPASAPLLRLIQGEEARALVQALARLPRRQCDVLHLVFYQEMSLADAAGVLGMRLGTARTHYARGKARLRDLLGLERT